MNTKILFNEWENVTLKYTADTYLCHNIFNELIAHYAESGRYYHNLTHIETMLKDLHTVYEDGLPDALFFAVWFHDAVYNALFKNNEERSAALAVKKLQQLKVPNEIITEAESLILKTSNHLEAEANDETTRTFLDIDMKILGADESTYNQYAQAVRKEYAIYPDMLFNRGRKKFIEKAQASKRIYKSDQFFNLYEQQARKNLLTELNQLL